MTEVAPDVRRELVEWARPAQNAHNIQPWRVVLHPRDPTARQLTMSMGTFLAVLEARAARLGWAVDIDLFSWRRV